MVLSGTSMATPHVAGYAAYILTLDSSLTPAAVESVIQLSALNNILSGIRKFIGPQHLSASRETNRLPPDSFRNHQRFGQQRCDQQQPVKAPWFWSSLGGGLR